MNNFEFRGVSVETGEMIHGYLFEHIWEKGHLSYIIKGGRVPALTMPSSEFVEVIPESVGFLLGEIQSGEKLYTNAIVKQGMRISVVKFINGQARLISTKFWASPSDRPLYLDDRHLVILGDAHNHPQYIK